MGVVEVALGPVFPCYQELITRITADPLGLKLEWRYYKDGKAWLCKVVYKKKTVFWLSVWDSCFKVSFYFTEKNKSGINELAIDQSIKECLMKNNRVGKLIPVTIEVTENQQTVDVVEMIKYKKDTL